LIYITPTPRTLFFSLFTPPVPTAIYTLSLHDALPISSGRFIEQQHLRGAGQLHGEIADPARTSRQVGRERVRPRCEPRGRTRSRDRKSTRLNSSHLVISYAVFCLKKKKHKKTNTVRLT